MSEDQFEISDEIQQGVKEAFQVGAKWLEKQDDLLFLFFPDGERKSLSPITNCEDQWEVLEKVRNWARDPSTTAPWFIQMSFGKVNGRDGVNALIAHCAERSQKEGFVLAQKLSPGDDGYLKPAGEIDFITRIPNDFFEPRD